TQPESSNPPARLGHQQGGPNRRDPAHLWRYPRICDLPHRYRGPHIRPLPRRCSAHTRPYPPRQPLCFPSPFPAPAPSRAPSPAAPPGRSGPARHRPLALAPGGGAGRAAVRSPVRAGGVPIACQAPGLATPLGLLAVDADDSGARKGSLRKLPEHLSGARKAIRVLTSGGVLKALPASIRDGKDQIAGTPGGKGRRGAGSGLPLPCSVERALQEGLHPGPKTGAPWEDILH
ncbi:uncharacterized protein LOC113221476, partial [Piliocolobus tephrosceles]|uniref:uncharacterized protein LOC113221476 n=1 Tax=Piliocolobus tephrosceles TaxID=591936 RepID=UPI000E6B3B9E